MFSKAVNLFTKKKSLVFLLSFIFIVVFIITLANSFADLTPTSSVTVSSTTLNYSNGEEGSWQYTKSAKWISNSKARVTINLSTKEKKKNDYTDVILVLDTSGSMLGDKLTQVQKDVNSLINDTIPKGNKIALITFSDTATVVNDFTDNITLLQESINNLTVAGETNYYQALVKVDDILSTYNKEFDRECVVLFLTDGLPTIDTPNEVGQYNYLKTKYEYLDINGIQYEFGDEEILEGVKNITDTQYIADRESLNEFLYRASISAAIYDNFTLTDYVNTKYFNLENISNVDTTFGTASIIDNRVVWDLSGLKSGAKATLAVDINLNDDLVGVGGIYSIHNGTDIFYKIGTTSTTESTGLTPVLKDNYVVDYEANAPTGCIVSNMPEQKSYLVFDKVKIEDTVPTCEGYQFKKWEIVTANVENSGDTYFIMPESNVVVRAVWKKVGLVKSMDGTIAKSQTLYRIVAEDSKGIDTKVNFKISPTNADSGVYTRNGTENDEYPVHYYRGTIDNNSVLFAGFCWKMVRTTDTGGVKMIYNGTLTDTYELIPIVRNGYNNLSNDSVYPYTYDTTTKKWKSTNKKSSTTSTISFSISGAGTYVLSYSISSQQSYDKAYFYKDNVQIGSVSGINSATISLGELTSENVITIKYAKSNFGSYGDDSVTFSVDEQSTNIVKTCNNTGEASQIGRAGFNSASKSPADVGYMYGTRYTTAALYPGVGNALDESYMYSSSNHYYSNSITYSNGTYSLVNATQKSWTDNYSDLVGYYTCRNTSTTCTTVYYIVGTSSNYQYDISLSDGLLDPLAQTITLGKGVTDNGNGTYSLTEIVVIKRKDWFTVYSDYKNYYVCRDLVSTTCVNKNPIISTSSYALNYDRTFNFIYGNDVVWDGTKYTLIDTFNSSEFWSDVRTKVSSKYHYSCFNTTGECSTVYYIHYFGNSSEINCLVLSNGKNIETVKEEMFNNVTSSSIKQKVDTWYKANMDSYTEKLEDTIWCNDRTIYSGALLGKDVDAGTDGSAFGPYNRQYSMYSPSVICTNKARDGFTVSTASGGNGKLTYPIGLLTNDEVLLTDYAVYSNNNYWTMSPFNFSYYGVSIFSSNYGASANNSVGIRPAISLAKGTKITGGDGTVNDPYVIDMDS